MKKDNLQYHKEFSFMCEEVIFVPEAHSLLYISTTNINNRGGDCEEPSSHKT
jgi:hypothetical protein